MIVFALKFLLPLREKVRMRGRSVCCAYESYDALTRLPLTQPSPARGEGIEVLS